MGNKEEDKQGSRTKNPHGRRWRKNRPGWDIVWDISNLQLPREIKALLQPAECACAINPGVSRVSFLSVFSTSVDFEQIHALRTQKVQRTPPWIKRVHLLSHLDVTSSSSSNGHNSKKNSPQELKKNKMREFNVTNSPPPPQREQILLIFCV